MNIGSNLLVNYTAYVNDINYAGQIEEVTLPKPSTKDVELIAGGIESGIDIPVGIEKGEAQIVCSSHAKELLTCVTLPGLESTKLTLRGALKSALDGSVIQDKVVLVGRFSSLDEGAWKPLEPNKWTMTFKPLFYERYLDGEEVLYVDVKNMVRRIGGVDVIEAERTAMNQG